MTYLEIALNQMGMSLTPCHWTGLARIDNKLMVLGSIHSNTNTDTRLIGKLQNATSD